MGRNLIFKDKRKLAPNYIPQKLTGRKEEMRELVRCFKPVLKGGADQRIIVIGPTGSGKTSLGIVFGRELESYAEEIHEGIEWVRTDCRRWRTSWQVLGDLLKSSIAGTEPQGLGEEEILKRIVETVNSDRDRYVFMVDDLDTLIDRDNAEFLYTLTRIGEESREMGNLSLVLSLKDIDALKNLDEATRSTLFHNYLRLGGYDRDRIYEILKRRESVAL
ncbi:MAG: Cdc6/Cdc18 family protein, partial [Candidatus Hadarchaeota archaeon]